MLFEKGHVCRSIDKPTVSSLFVSSAESSDCMPRFCANPRKRIWIPWKFRRRRKWRVCYFARRHRVPSGFSPGDFVWRSCRVTKTMKRNRLPPNKRRRQSGLRDVGRVLNFRRGRRGKWIQIVNVNGTWISNFSNIFADDFGFEYDGALHYNTPTVFIARRLRYGREIITKSLAVKRPWPNVCHTVENSPGRGHKTPLKNNIGPNAQRPTKRRHDGIVCSTQTRGTPLFVNKKSRMLVNKQLLCKTWGRGEGG